MAARFSSITAASLCLLTSAVFALVYLRNRRFAAARDDLERDFQSLRQQTKEYPEELIREQLARNYAFLGESGQTKLRSSYVVVVGLGGVGSHAAHMLARAGVSRMLLIDFDQLTLSSLNRHALGTLADVGLAKTLVVQQHLSRIVPFSDIRIATALFSKDNAHELLSGSPDFVLDCIDNIDTKIQLIAHCLANKLTLISSMGASGKADPSRIVIGDISESYEDPLARKCRQLLRDKIRLGAKFKCVYSLEKECTYGLINNPESNEIDKQMMESSESGSINNDSKNSEGTRNESSMANADYALLPNFRSRTLPVLGPIPALFGNMMATHVITELSLFHTDPLSNKLRQSTYIKIHQELLHTLRNLTPPEQCTVSVADVAFLFEEVWRARSPISFNNERVKLVRWDNAKPSTLDNLILLVKKEALKHASVAIQDVTRVYGMEVVKRINERFGLLKRWDASRKM